MLLTFYLIFVFIISIQCQSAFKQEANPNLCNFFDTVNITDGYRNPDDSITFNDIKFDKKNYATFIYTYSANHEKIPVPAHIRGCICKYKNCVRLCCQRGYVFEEIEFGNRLQHKCVRTPNNAVTEIDLDDYDNITFVSENPCAAGYWLDPDDPADSWRLLPNGSLSLDEEFEEQFVVNHDGYCLAYKSNNDTGKYDTKVMFCVSDVPDSEVAQIAGGLIYLYPTLMLVSVVFLSLTLFVYFWIEELRTLHGKLFMCYLASFITGYSVLAFTIIVQWHAFKGPILCIILAEIIHTAFIGGFILLSTIGYDIWRAVGGANQRSNQFHKYSLFAFGTTFFIVAITNVFDHVDLLDNHLRPGLGTTVCWLQDSKSAHFLYLYSIIIIILTINTVFFILTKRKIDRAQNISSYATNDEDSKKYARGETNADRLKFYIRLFVIMGITWFIEIISWLMGGENIFIYILDAVTMLLGPIIFCISVSNPHVKQLMKHKWSTMTEVPSVNSMSIELSNN